MADKQTQAAIRKAIMEGGLLGLANNPKALQDAYQQGGILGATADVGGAALGVAGSQIADYLSPFARGASNLSKILIGPLQNSPFAGTGLSPEVEKNVSSLAAQVAANPSVGIGGGQPGVYGDFSGVENPQIVINTQTGRAQIVSQDPRISDPQSVSPVAKIEEALAPPVPTKPTAPRFDFDAIPEGESLEEALARFDKTKPEAYPQATKDEDFNSIIGGLAQGAANVPSGYFPPTVAQTLASIGAGAAAERNDREAQERRIREQNLDRELAFQQGRTQFTLDFQQQQREQAFQEEKIKYAERIQIYDQQLAEYERKRDKYKIHVWESGYAVEKSDGTIEYKYNAESPDLLNAKANMVRALGGSEEDARAGSALELKMNEVPEQFQPAHKAATEVFTYGVSPELRARAIQSVLDKDEEVSGGVLKYQYTQGNTNATKIVEKRAYNELVAYYLQNPDEGAQVHNVDSGEQRGLFGN